MHTQVISTQRKFMLTPQRASVTFMLRWTKYGGQLCGGQLSTPQSIDIASVCTAVDLTFRENRFRSEQLICYILLVKDDTFDSQLRTLDLLRLFCSSAPSPFIFLFKIVKLTEDGSKILPTTEILRFHHSPATEKLAVFSFVILN